MTLGILLRLGNFSLEASFWPTHLRPLVRDIARLVTIICERILLDIPALGHAGTM